MNSQPTESAPLPIPRPRWTETLLDGTHIVVRTLVRVDGNRERGFLESLSPETLRFRFLGQVHHPSEALIEKLTDIDMAREVALAAVVPADADERILGVARYSTTDDGTRCECAVTVLDDWHHRGLGTVLMRHLIELARAAGIREMYSIDSSENSEMAALANFLGFRRELDPEEPTQVVHRLSLTAA